MPLNPPGGDGPAGDGSNSRKEIYVEFKQVGQAMKVVAVDSETGTEVVIMGPATASRNDLERVAVRKLKTQLAKTSDQHDPDPGEEDGNEPGPKGWIV